VLVEEQNVCLPHEMSKDELLQVLTTSPQVVFQTSDIFKQNKTNRNELEM
jgi:hypothetical protein